MNSFWPDESMWKIFFLDTLMTILSIFKDIYFLLVGLSNKVIKRVGTRVLNVYQKCHIRFHITMMTIIINKLPPAISAKISPIFPVGDEIVSLVVVDIEGIELPDVVV